MNNVILIGRLTKEPAVTYLPGENPLCIARYTLAVDRRIKRDAEQSADFISCLAFGRQAEFAEKYLSKGMKIAINGRISTGNYTNKAGQKIYTTDVVVENHEFVEKKEQAAGSDHVNNQAAAGSNQGRFRQAADSADPDGFINIPDGIEEELPFH